ncbi:MAG: hypothetical protein DRJ97_00965 [Thermoprotei archaeon]|nr:MAG: hypothetical protein DRJ97_00965 [Thermoprotei archaeon]
MKVIEEPYVKALVLYAAQDLWKLHLVLGAVIKLLPLNASLEEEPCESLLGEKLARAVRSYCSSSTTTRGLREGS